MNKVRAKQNYDIKKVLVILNEKILATDEIRNSALIDRAIALAHATGCELELFLPCHDTGLQQPMYLIDEDVIKEREKIDEVYATKLEELVQVVNSEGLVANYESRWDHPRAEAILRKIEDSEPDIILKQFNEQNYVLGMFGTDWELIRQSPSHVWFVKENQERIDKSTTEIHRLITAVGTMEDEEIISAEDYDVFGVANALADYFHAENVPVHAYQVPQTAHYNTYTPFIAGISPPLPEAESVLDNLRQDIARKHGDSIRKFAEDFNINPELVQISRGNPDHVIQELAASLHADLIIMAARNLSRWERFVGSISASVTAEPVVAASPCDVLFIKQKEERTVPVTQGASTRGAAIFNIEKAILDPEGTFITPEGVLDADEIGKPLRLRVLQAWERDIRQQMAEASDEEAALMRDKAETLVDIDRCRERLVAAED